MNSQRGYAHALDMRRIAAITFDLWDTLIQELPGGSDRIARARIESIADLLESCGRPHTIQEIEEAYVKTGSFLDFTWGKSRDISVRDQMLFMLSCIEWRLPSKLDKGSFEEVERIYSRSMLDQRPVLLPKVKETLSAVDEAGFGVGLICNTGRTPGSILREVMSDMGIPGHFEVTTFSDEVLVRKPAPVIFRTTLEGLRTQASLCVHVGDDPVSDIGGARNVGMRSVQVSGTKWQKSHHADGHVERLDEVLELVDSFR